MRIPLSTAARLLVEKTEREAEPLMRRAESLMRESLAAILEDNGHTTTRAVIERDEQGRPCALVIDEEESDDGSA